MVFPPIQARVKQRHGFADHHIEALDCRVLMIVASLAAVSCVLYVG
jgi:hypothetical protein